MLEPLRTVTATRYAEALREGGSLPGLLEADDDGMYVTKFRGAGQGEKALVAEVVAGELGRALGLRVPELVVVDVDPALGAAEPDPEIQELIAASGGTNLRMDFLRGAPVHAQAPAERRAVARDLPGEWGSAEVYASHLTARLEHREAFVEEAEDARA